MRSLCDFKISELAAGVAACAIGVVFCVVAICVWHLAHSAAPTNLSREAADFVGQKPGESMRSSVAMEIFVADAFERAADDAFAPNGERAPGDAFAAR